MTTRENRSFTTRNLTLTTSDFDVHAAVSNACQAIAWTGAQGAVAFTFSFSSEADLAVARRAARSVV